MKSEIVITQDFANFIDELKKNVKICKVYEGDEFLLDDAKSIMQNAYLIEEYEKYFVLAYKNYSIQAQNYMLKLLEEPPNNVYFKILVTSKNILIPTIKSRLVSKKISSFKNDFKLDLDLKNINLLDVAGLEIEKADISDFISALFSECIRQKITLSGELLEEFYKCYELSKLNSNAKALSTRLLLGIIRERG